MKGKPNIIDITQKKRLQWYGHAKRMREDRIPKLIMEWIPLERRKRGRPRKTRIGVQAAMITRNLELDQWRNREEWRLVSGRRLQLLLIRTDRTSIQYIAYLNSCVSFWSQKSLTLVGDVAEFPFKQMDNCTSTVYSIRSLLGVDVCHREQKTYQMQQYHLAGRSTFTLERLQYLYTTNTMTCTIL